MSGYLDEHSALLRRSTLAATLVAVATVPASMGLELPGGVQTILAPPMQMDGGFALLAAAGNQVVVVEEAFTPMPEPPPGTGRAQERAAIPSAHTRRRYTEPSSSWRV